MNKPAMIMEHIRPACLALPGKIDYSKKAKDFKFTITGWGDKFFRKSTGAAQFCFF
jgi:hypothetical protein